MKYIIYCRKSTDTEDKQVLSLDSQEGELLTIAKNNNLEVIQIFRESMSAKSEGRPIFNKVLEMIAKKEADGIICWKLDRLARNFIDGGKIIDMLQHGTIKEIRTYESTHLPSDNVLLLAVNFGMANQFVRDLSVNVKRGNRTKLEKGEWPNHAPLGYLNDKLNKTILVDKERSKYVVRAFEMYATGGYGVNELTAILYADGFRTRSGNKVYRNQLERIIKNPFYVGLMQRDGKLYEGNHQALISKSTFDKINRVANDRSRPRPKRLFFPLRGFLKCENCNCLITASKKKGHDYYYCTNGKKICTEHKSYIREIDLYKAVADVLSNLHFSERKIELMYQSAKERANSDTGYTDQALDNLQKELESLTTKESKLLDIFLAEQISKELYDQRVLELYNNRVSLKKQINELQKKRPAFTLEPVKNVFIQGSKSRKEFLDGDNIQKREIVKNLLWNLSIKDKNIVNIQYKNVFEILAKAPKNRPILELLGR
jgi:DNA invertase Pin-like site-specific DNA recombinase